MSTLTATKVQGSRLGAKTLLGLAGATSVGVLVAAYPVMGLEAIVACLFLYGILRWSRRRMEVWQVSVLAALTAYIILNYGFDNFAIGIDFPFGDLMLFSALIYVILKAPKGFLGGLLKDPIIACLFALLMMSCVHLLIDVPRYGFYAIRDSSVFFEAVFLILGLAWARNSHNIRLFVHWMFWILLVNLVYTYTFPWNEQIQAHSPTSGIFHPVPLFGNYEQNGVFLVAGVLFCFWLAPAVAHWPRWVYLGLAVLDLGGLAIIQLRSMYVGIVVVLLLLLFLGETRKLAKIGLVLAWGLGGVLLLLTAVTALGIKIQGRMGPVDLSFIEEHAETILAIDNPNTRMSHDVDREDWYGEVWNRVRSSPTNMAVGEGFGQVLIDFVNEQGIPVRQPHNTSLTVLARLGFIGLSIWLLFLFLLGKRYVQFLRAGTASPGIHALVLWLLMYSVLAFLLTSVQPEFEFSHGAVPFFFMQGLAIGIMRNAEGRSDFQPLAV